jgi:hypothetical protein
VRRGGGVPRASGDPDSLAPPREGEDGAAAHQNPFLAFRCGGHGLWWSYRCPNPGCSFAYKVRSGFVGQIDAETRFLLRGCATNRIWWGTHSVSWVAELLGWRGSCQAEKLPRRGVARRPAAGNPLCSAIEALEGRRGPMVVRGGPKLPNLCPGQAPGTVPRRRCRGQVPSDTNEWPVVLNRIHGAPGAQWRALQPRTPLVQA